MTDPLGTEERDAWDDLIRGFTGALLHPERVELVITDQFQAVAGEYAVRAPVRANTSMTAEDYQAIRADGAAAAAKTSDLGDGQVAVVAAAAVVRLGPESAERILLHEAQHVRLDQGGNSAWGVHRRVNLLRPADIGYDFIWTAESLIDEFRCERALNEAGLLPLDVGSDPADYPDIVRSFDEVRSGYRRTGNLLAAYQGAFSRLDRLGQFLAYGAAHIAVDSTIASIWTSIPSMGHLLDIVSGIPATDTLISDDELAGFSVEIARMLRQVLRDNGFDSSVRGDDLYFELLR